MKQDFGDAVVVITSLDPEENSDFGSGFVIDIQSGDTLVLTCAHVFEDTESNQQVLVNGRLGSLVVSGSTQGIDLAVIKVKEFTQYRKLPLANRGMSGLAFEISGVYEYDVEGTTAKRKLQGTLGKDFEVLTQNYQGSAKAWDLTIHDKDLLQSGYSGSPVIDTETGYVLGVVSHRLKQGKEGHAIAIDALIQVWPDAASLLVSTQAPLQTPSITTISQLYRVIPWRVLGGSFGITCILTTLRFFGAFELLELKAYDHVLTARPIETSNQNHVIIVEATTADLESQKQNGESATLTKFISDAALIESIHLLKQYGASVIGVDLYLLEPLDAFSSAKGTIKLEDQSTEEITALELLKSHKDIFGVCLQPYADEPGESPPPTELIPISNIGFSNFKVDDNDGVLRRHLIEYILTDNQAGSKCRSEQSFNLLIALQHLEKQGSQSEQLEYEELLIPPYDYLKIGNKIIPRIDSFGYGGYRRFSPIDAFELMLNYRSPEDGDLEKAFPHFSIESLRRGELEPATFQNKIVLLGLTGGSAQDYFLTPYGVEVFGVTLQAHMIDQIVRAVLEDRALIWAWPDRVEFFWLLLWAIGGGLLGRYVHHLKLLGVGLFVGVGGIYFSCLFTMFLASGWIPMIPTYCAFLLTNGFVVYTLSKSGSTAS